MTSPCGPWWNHDGSVRPDSARHDGRLSFQSVGRVSIHQGFIKNPQKRRETDRTVCNLQQRVSAGQTTIPRHNPR